MTGSLFFNLLYAVIIWSSPVIFFVGLLLMLYGSYNNLEKKLAKEMGLRKKLLPKLEKNIYSFHEWCLKRNAAIGAVCIIYSLAVFFVL